MVETDVAQEVLDAEVAKEGIQIVVEVLSDDITEAKEEDDDYLLRPLFK